MAVSIKDIAKQVNMSTATVSRYLNNPEIVSESAREKISEAIKKLEYSPNSIARSLTKKNSYTIGIMISDIQNTFYPPVLRGIEDTIEQYDYSTFLCNTDYNVQREKKYIDLMLRKMVSGVICIGTREIAEEKNEHIFALNKKIPVLLIYDSFEDRDDIKYITTDEVLGEYRAVKFMYDLGHRNMAFLCGPKEFSTYRKKCAGYVKALQDFGIPVRDEFIVYQEPYELGGYQATIDLLQRPLKPTAILTSNDQMAVGVLLAISKLGLKAPDDVSVIGYSNASFSPYTIPSLSTIDQFGYRIGKMAGLKILQMIDNPETAESVTLNPELLVRGSAGACPR